MADGVIPRWDHNSKLSPEQREEAVRRYAAGELPHSICKDYGVTSEAIANLARRRGISFPGRTSRRHTINEAAFAEITPESAYWIGMMLTDGNVSRSLVQLRLGEKDKEHVEKFRAFLGSSHAIVKQEPSGSFCKATPSYILGVNSARMARDLARYGVIPRKTKIAEVCPELSLNRDFWRGAVDGDGGLYKYGTRRMVFLCGGIPILKQFQRFIWSITPHAAAPIIPNNTIFGCRIYNTNADAVVQTLYAGCSVALDRKLRMVPQFTKTRYHEVLSI